mmetsp:Transcript_21397/g.63734  ORF Transcript_21397/g.63734 Transcript_21397/m.63734 type:complete len:182 (+) Transcript_21397:249-794(+)
MSLRAAVYVILQHSRGTRVTRLPRADGLTGPGPRPGGRSVLMMRRQGGWGAGQWTLPSGHVDPDPQSHLGVLETPTRAAVREVIEEVGVVVPEDSLEIVHAVYRTSTTRTGTSSESHDARTYVDFFLEAARWSGTPAIMEPSKCDQIRFVDVDGDLPRPTLPHVRRALRSWKAGIPFAIDS